MKPPVVVHCPGQMEFAGMPENLPMPLPEPIEIRARVRSEITVIVDIAGLLRKKYEDFAHWRQAFDAKGCSIEDTLYEFLGEVVSVQCDQMWLAPVTLTSEAGDRREVVREDGFPDFEVDWHFGGQSFTEIAERLSETGLL